jgi:hypothetical protein
MGRIPFCPTDLGLISLTHYHSESKVDNLPKRYRLLIRFIICFIIFLLPLSQTLNSLELISLVTALLWFTIGVETWGRAAHAHVWIGEKQEREYTCKSNLGCIQGEERIIDDNERMSEDGDIIFGV